MHTPDEQVDRLHLILPPVPKPLAKYRTAVVVGEVLYTSGHGPLMPDGKLITGRVGADLTLEQGRDAARQTGLAILSTLKATLGSLNKIKRLVKSFALVNCTADFIDQPKVIDAYSELMAEVFGDEAGVGARSAVGAISLPRNMAVEIEAVFQI